MVGCGLLLTTSGCAEVRRRTRTITNRFCNQSINAGWRFEVIPQPNGTTRGANRDLAHPIEVGSGLCSSRDISDFTSFWPFPNFRHPAQVCFRNPPSSCHSWVGWPCEGLGSASARFLALPEFLPWYCIGLSLIKRPSDQNVRLRLASDHNARPNYHHGM